MSKMMHYICVRGWKYTVSKAWAVGGEQPALLGVNRPLLSPDWGGEQRGATVAPLATPAFAARSPILG